MSDELKEEVRAKVLQYLAFEKLETNKFEFKRQWYNLRNPMDKSEFLRDTTAIINSYGGDDGFIVFGVDEKTKELVDTLIEQSGYYDQSSIRDIVDTNIDKPFRFDIDYVSVKGKRLCVVHLHPSLDKPHIVIKYQDKKEHVFQNEIFLRSGSAKVLASKGDLDRMYIERNAIIVERKADVSINFHGFQFTSESDSKSAKHVLVRSLLIENRGTRILPIYKIYLNFDLGTSRLLFIHETQAQNPIIIDPNSYYRDNIRLVASEVPPNSQTSDKLNDVVNKILDNPTYGAVICTLILATGESLPANLFMPNINHAKSGLRIA